MFRTRNLLRSMLWNQSKTLRVRGEAGMGSIALESGGKLCYEKVVGDVGAATVLYVPGLMSGMEGDKTKYLKQYCAEKGYSYVHYDPVCIGKSVLPGSWQELQFQDWVENAGTILQDVVGGPAVLVGSSMGGWISLYLATQDRYRHLVKSMLLIAPAINFIRPYYREIVGKLPKEAVDKLERGEVYYLVDDFYGEKHIKKSFAENSAKYELDLSSPLPVDVPVRILHGVKDDSVPFKGSLQLMMALSGEQVELFYRKEAGHRFVEADSMKLIVDSLDTIIGKL